MAAGDFQEYLVDVPDRIGSAPLPTHTAGVEWPELQAPSTNRLEGHVDAASGQELLNVPVAEPEAIGEPDGRLDDRGMEAMSAAEIGSHSGHFSSGPPVNMTVPSALDWLQGVSLLRAISSLFGLLEFTVPQSREKRVKVLISKRNLACI